MQAAQQSKFTEAQIDRLVRRLHPAFDDLQQQQQNAHRTQILEYVDALESEGWEVGLRSDRSTFEMAQWMFLRIESNIAGSTPKAVIILSLHVAIISATILQGERIVGEATNSVRNLVGALLVALFLAAVSAIWLAFQSVAPRIAKSTRHGSLLFFGSIANMSKSNFIEAFSSADRQAFTADLMEEVYALSGLAQWKHGMFVNVFRVVLLLEIPLMAVIALLVAFA